MKFFLLIALTPFFVQAQKSSIKTLEMHSGFFVARPLGVKKEISYQSGFITSIGGAYNFALSRESYLTPGISFSSTIYNMDGYFTKQSNRDYFIITPDNVKVNSLTLSTVSVDFGYKKIFNGKGVVGFNTVLNYNYKLNRNYKIGASKFTEKYNFNRKINFGINSIIGFLSTSKKTALYFIIGYSFTSIGSNTKFHPFYTGITFNIELGK